MKNIVCIFSHPDDEVFGPGGTIAKLSKKYNIYLLCATKGEVGQKGKTLKAKSLKLANVRVNELRKSTKILGIKKVYLLGFKDGELSNNLYHKLAAKIRSHLRKLKPEVVITYEPMGVSGHIDHIVVSMVTWFVVKKLKFIKQLWQVCLPDFRAKQRQDYYICFSPGYKMSEIDKVINIKDVWNKKLEAIKQHKSQFKDFQRVMKWVNHFPKKEYFLVKKLH